MWRLDNAQLVQQVIQDQKKPNINILSYLIIFQLDFSGRSFSQVTSNGNQVKTFAWCQKFAFYKIVKDSRGRFQGFYYGM